jgi:hypothetical protein
MGHPVPRVAAQSGSAQARCSARRRSGRCSRRPNRRQATIPPAAATASIRTPAVAPFFHDAPGAESRKRPQVKSALRLKDRGGTWNGDNILDSLHRSDWTRVLRHDGVVGQQRNPLYSRLRHQNSVERILMNRWQAIDGNDVIADD